MQVFVVTKGGPGSGHHGHEGRPGQRGGSAPDEGTPDLIAVSPTKSKKYLVEIKSSWPEKTDRREMAESVFDERAELDDEIHVAKDSSGGTVAVMTLDDDEEEGVVWLNILATRQKGYGRFMIKRAAEKAAEKGLGLKLIATEKAKSFYRKIGMRGTSNTFIFTQDDCKNISRVLKSDIIDKFNSVSADDEPDDGVFCVPRKKATKILVVEKGGQGSGHKKKKEDAMPKKLVIKSDEKRLVFGEVYAPLRVDTDNEAMTAEQIERMAHNFLAKGRLWKVDTSHNLKMSGCVVVESFIARKNDPDGFIEGSWVLGVKVLPDDLWSAVKSGELNGFSFYGMVEKRAMRAKVIATKRLTGKTELSTDGSLPPHAHDVDMMFGENGAVIECETAEELGHTHKITQATATKASKDHSHRLIISE